MDMSSFPSFSLDQSTITKLAAAGIACDEPGLASRLLELHNIQKGTAAWRREEQRTLHAAEIPLVCMAARGGNGESLIRTKFSDNKSKSKKGGIQGDMATAIEHFIAVSLKMFD